MAFYDLTKDERTALVDKISDEIASDISKGLNSKLNRYFADEDTYIRKTAYLAIGRIYFEQSDLRQKVLAALSDLFLHEKEKVRQTVINAAGEIGKAHFEQVKHFFDKGLFDAHHAPRNAVIGSIKKMGEVNPEAVLPWAASYLDHPDKEIRREICHGIELRGRKFPQDILPLLQRLENDKTARVRKTLVHVIGQIAYKKGCLKTVLDHLQGWQNKRLVNDALAEIIDVHHRYRNFSALTQEQAITLISLLYGDQKHST